MTLDGWGVPTWSPDSQRILLQSEEGIQVVGTGGEGRVQIPGATVGAWSADGRRIAYQDAAGFWTVDANGSNRQQLMVQRVASIQKMVWLAQDEILLTTRGNSAGGGTIFELQLIKEGKLSLLASGVRTTLWLRPDRRQAAFIEGAPVGRVPGEVGFYPPIPPSGLQGVSRKRPGTSWERFPVFC